MTKIAKVLLVAPFFSTNARGVERDEVDDAYPLGIAYLHGALEAAGRAVETLDCRYFQEDHVLSRVASLAPAIVGIQVLSNFRGPLLLLAKRIQSRFPETRVLLGGPHVSVRASKIAAKHPGILIAAGESETTIVALAERIAAAESIG